MKLHHAFLVATMSLCLGGCNKATAVAGAKFIGAAFATAVAEQAATKVVEQVDLSLQAPHPPEAAAPTWNPGAPHPSAAHVFASQTPGTWVTKAGYAWNNPANAAEGVQWQPGARHPQHAAVLASAQEGNFVPAAGYNWVDAANSDLRVVWQPGQKHPNFEHVIAADGEGQWRAEEGFRWVAPDDATNFAVVTL